MSPSSRFSSLLAAHPKICRIQMDVDNRKNEEKGASKKVDLEIEVRRQLTWLVMHPVTFCACPCTGLA